MSKKYIEQAFLMDSSLYRDGDLHKHVLETKMIDMAKAILDLMADGQAYICEMAVKEAERESMNGYVTRMFLSYEPVTRCGVCRHWRSITPVYGKCNIFDNEMPQQGYCSFGEEISERQVK